MRYHLFSLACLFLVCTSLASAKTLIFEIGPGGLLKDAESSVSLYIKNDKQPGFLGSWTAPGLATMDYPSSYIRCQTLTFYEDGRFCLRNIEKRLARRDPIEYASTVTGEFLGEWEQVGDNRIVVTITLADQ
jgi:hypothetical protein